MTTLSLYHSLHTRSELGTCCHNVVGRHLNPVLLDAGLQLFHIPVGSLPDILLQNASHNVVEGIEVWAGGGSKGLVPEISKVLLAEIPILCGSMAGGTILGPNILVFVIVGLQPWQDLPP